MIPTQELTAAPVIVTERMEADPSNYELTMFMGSNIIGLACIQNSQWIHSVWINPCLLRRGFGTMLVKEALKRLAEDGHTSACLDVKRDNVAAMAMYEKIGFKYAEVRRSTDHFDMFIRF